jgi:hypothetical protein
VASDIDKSLRIITLKIIRKVVELEVQNASTPAFDWEGWQWENFKPEIRK